MKPVARRNGLVVRDLADEVVVYDKERHEAHCLNGTAATVFRNADGWRSVSDLAALLSAGGGPGAQGLVEMALGQLGEARLLESSPSPVSKPGLPRRDACDAWAWAPRSCSPSSLRSWLRRPSEPPPRAPRVSGPLTDDRTSLLAHAS